MRHINKKFNSTETAFFCEQLRLMINGGISVCDSLFNMCEETESGPMHDTLTAAYESVKAQSSLADALEGTGAFQDHMIHMIRVGEQTGRLEEVLGALNSYYDRDMRFKAMIRSAVAYPLMLFAILAFIMGVLALKILPLFANMFDELSGSAGSSTASAIGTGLKLGRIFAVLLAVLLCLAGAVIVTACTPRGKAFLSRMAGHIPFISRLSRLMATDRFISSMTLIISSGMDIAAGLVDEARGCTNSDVRARILRCHDLYTEGKGFAEAVAEAGILKGMESRLLLIAARSGEEDSTFAGFAASYDDHVSTSLSHTAEIVETSLVVLLSLMVGAVLISVMVPLANLIAAVG